MLEAALYLCVVFYGKEMARWLAQGLVIEKDVEAVPKVIVEYCGKIRSSRKPKGGLSSHF